MLICPQLNFVATFTKNPFPSPYLLQKKYLVRRGLLYSKVKKNQFIVFQPLSFSPIHVKKYELNWETQKQMLSSAQPFIHAFHNYVQQLDI